MDGVKLFDPGKPCGSGRKPRKQPKCAVNEDHDVRFDFPKCPPPILDRFQGWLRADLDVWVRPPIQPFRKWIRIYAENYRLHVAIVNSVQQFQKMLL